MFWHRVWIQEKSNSQLAAESMQQNWTAEVRKKSEKVEKKFPLLAGKYYICRRLYSPFRGKLYPSGSSKVAIVLIYNWLHNKDIHPIVPQMDEEEKIRKTKK